MYRPTPAPRAAPIAASRPVLSPPVAFEIVAPPAAPTKPPIAALFRRCCPVLGSVVQPLSAKPDANAAIINWLRISYSS